MMPYIPIVSAVVTSLLLAAMLSSRLGRALQDIPNARSLHAVPVPRIGGVGIMAGLSVGWLLIPDALPWWLWLPCLLLFVVSLLDDRRSLAVLQRLAAHFAAAGILLLGSGEFGGSVPVLALLLLIVVWMTNLYNFMDGSDGLAGGMTLSGFTFYGIACLNAGEQTAAMLNFTVSASALAFLAYNFPPARVFMGDAGSIPLGFLAAAMGAWGWSRGCWEGWFPVMVFSPFIVDASVTLLKRTMRGAKITEAHRDHYYQRAIRMGWSHRKLVLVEYALMLGSGMSALALVGSAQAMWALIALCCVYAALMYPLDIAWNRYEKGRDV